jgi:multidrug efflux pump subunit AcrB
VLPRSSVARFRLVRAPGVVFGAGSSRAALLQIQTTEDANTAGVAEAVRRAVAERHAGVSVEWNALVGRR